MEAMAEFPDKFFDLAIVDPPYGAGDNFNFRFDQLYTNNKPGFLYWWELFRVSKNQIVWGGNYFANSLPESRCWISWYKAQPINSFSDFELAWTSFDRVAKSIKLESYGFNHADKKQSGNSTIHPTQKPVSLYRWLLTEFGGGRLLDTHLGSGSSRIAAHEMGFDFWGYELDKDYFEAQEKRFSQHISQLTIPLI
jgi:site-specific DNA-methyltransferase (adenine-specific)